MGRRQWTALWIVMALAVGIPWWAPLFQGAARVPAAVGQSAPPKDGDRWYRGAAATLERARALRPRPGPARRVIFFVGDGMGVATVTAARIREGQLRGGAGEDHALFFETLPHLALSKTYNTNQQTPDSAGTMTAMVTGVKTRAGVLSVDASTPRGEHRGIVALPTIVEEAEDRGIATGIVSTARLTHATPAACYAHAPERAWEDDTLLSPAARADGFPDIARQLVEFAHGDGIEVLLGGGSAHFLPQGSAPGARRGDGRDLLAELRTRYPQGAVVTDAEGLAAVKASEVSHLVGLFSPSHMPFELDRRAGRAPGPSLAEMTGKAIEVLEQRGGPYFLHVEAGRIDHAHHMTNAARALHDTIALSDAVRVAYEATDPEDTLIIVTADHSHVMTMAGYPTRGNDILGTVMGNDATGAPSGQPEVDATGRPFTTLSYANGPGYVPGPRPDLRGIDTRADDYRQETMLPMVAETHGGEEVAIYASGPAAHLLHGTREQHYIYHVMRHALRLDGGVAGP